MSASQIEHAPSSSTKGKWLKPVLFVAVLAALLVAWHFVPMGQWIKAFLGWVKQLGPVGPIVLGLVYIVATVLFIPGAILTLGAGFLFGVFWGSVTVSIGSTLGATAAFLVGRYLARDWVASKIEKNAKFRAIDQGVAREGWKIVGLTRLSPIFPFNLLNYAFGLTDVPLKQYVLASWIGMMPGTVLFVYIGSVAGDLATLGTGHHQRSTAEWILYAVGLLVTVLVTVLVTRIARRSLKEAIDDTEAE